MCEARVLEIIGKRPVGGEKTWLKSLYLSGIVRQTDETDKEIF